MDPEKTITFYCDLPQGEIDNLEQKLENYLPYGEESKYIIAHEISTATKKSHFHVICENLEWNKFRDNILIKKYQLKSKNKQFGKVKKIKDINKMISYIVKQGKLLKEPEEIKAQRRTNLDDNLIQEYLENSYQKEDDRSHIELCLDKLAALPYQYEFSDTDLVCKKIQILDYFKQNKLECNFNKVQRIFDMYLMRQEHLSANTIYEIMRQIRNNRI